MQVLYRLSYVGTDLECYRPASADRAIRRGDPAATVFPDATLGRKFAELAQAILVRVCAVASAAV